MAEIAPYVLDPSVRRIDALYDEPGIGLYDRYLLSIIAQHVDSASYDWVKFSCEPVYEIGAIPVDSTITLKMEFHVERLTSSAYHIDRAFPHEFKITKLDLTNNICAGTFMLTAVSTMKEDTIMISDGRFDVRYSQE